MMFLELLLFLLILCCSSVAAANDECRDKHKHGIMRTRMMRFLELLPFLLLLSRSSRSVAAADEHQREVLAEFFRATGGPTQWRPQRWPVDVLEEVAEAADSYE